MAENNSEVNNNEVEEQKQEKSINKKPKFFQKVWYSIIKFEKYPEMSAEGVPSALKYLCEIMSVFAIVIAIAVTFQLGQMVNSGIKYIKNELPDFYYKDGVLTVESDNAITIDNVKLVGKIIIDSSTEDEDIIEQYKNSITDEEEGIILLKDKMIIKNVLSSGEITYNYKEALEQNNITEFTKQNIIDFTEGQEIASLYVSFAIVIFIYAFIMYLVSTAMDSILLAILGYITALIAKMKMKFVAIYNMAVYSLTLSIILNLIYIIVNMFTGFRITYFQVMYTSVAYIYLVAAIFIIKSEFVKKQAELMKVIEEQQKQQEDTLENKNDDEDKKENKDTKKEDKKEDTKKEDKDNGEEPEGSNA